MRTISLYVIAGVIAAGCQHSENRYLDREVAASEMTGVWRLTPDAVKDLRDVGYTAPLDPRANEITLDADGSCRFHTLRTVLLPDGKPAPPIDAPCRWTLRNVGHQAVMIDLQTDPPRTVHYFFGKSSTGALALWQYASDPDAWRYVEYVKVAS